MAPTAPDQRAALLTAAAAVSAFAALSDAARPRVRPERPPVRVDVPPATSETHRRHDRSERVEDLAAIIAAW